jgi:hypothetical protein
MEQHRKEQWKMILDAPVDRRRREFYTYCASLVDEVEMKNQTIEAASYTICGIAGQIRDQLRPSDRGMVDIACNLELPMAQRSTTNADWNELTELVHRANLPE